jgi:predicted GNAT family N-acyltransferase
MQGMAAHAQQHFPTLLPKLGAQTHAIPFYAKLGWQKYGPKYDDGAGIMHTAMVLPPEDQEALHKLQLMQEPHRLPQAVRQILQI